MKLLQHLLVAALPVLALGAAADSARADGVPAAGPVYAGPPQGAPQGGYPGHNNGHAMPQTLGRAILESHPNAPNGQHAALFFRNFHKTRLPVFQAAPWYNYWPYDGHFQTPAPISGQFYGPPMTGNFPVNPYFPGPGTSGFGPMPGGPAPGWPSAMPPSAGR